MIGNGAPVTVSQYALTEYSTTTYTSQTGKTSASTPAQAGTGVFICLGQSLMGNHGASNNDPASANVLQVDTNAGGVFRCKDPVIGTTGSTGGLLSRLGPKVIADIPAFTKTLIAPGAVGGTSINDHTPPGIFHHRMRVAILRVRQLGLTPTAVLWEQGQGDWGAISSANYKAGIYALIDAAIGLGCTSPWFLAKCTLLAGSTDSTIRTAIADLWGTTYRGVNIYAGPDIDTLTGVGSNRQADNTHLDDTGNNAAAQLWADALNVVF